MAFDSQRRSCETRQLLVFLLMKTKNSVKEEEEKYCDDSSISTQTYKGSLVTLGFLKLIVTENTFVRNGREPAPF